MNGSLIVLVIVFAVHALPGYAGAQVITNDDLERRYPPEVKSTRGAAQHFIEESGRVDCGALYQEQAEARHEAYHASDKETRKEKIAAYDKLYAVYWENCGKPKSTR